ncbi:MAG: hypothetical protein LBQ60_20650 [Bacteroidales bacterium]|jgi:glycerophosphoryl diester phosphodiesterase|nr:hypothetical protein [Bacteroidales bacterium]
MKKLFVSFLFLNLLFACKDSASENDVFLEIDVSSRTLNFKAEGGSQSVTVSSSENFYVSSDHPDWCKPTISSYITDNLKISVSKNETFENRVAIVTVSADGAENLNITINQAGIQPVLTVDKNSVSVQFGKPEFTLDITANIPIAFDLPGWITGKEGNTWQNGKKTYAFSISPLPDGLSYREGSILIKAEDPSIDVKSASVSVTQKAIPKIIAHRGYWVPNYPHNSLASLQRAIDLGVYGSELDVYITTDGVVVLNHDATINGINIEQSSYADLAGVRLSNGEPIPTLQACIDLIKNQSITKLIIEIKAHSTTVNENRAAAAVLELVNNGGVADLVDYISFSQNICKELIKNNPQNRVAYLNGNLTPESLKLDNYWGLDYSITTLKANTGWVKIAKEIGLTTNVWTVNTTADFDYFISMGVDFITTDYPQNLKAILFPE